MNGNSSSTGVFDNLFSPQSILEFTFGPEAVGKPNPSFSERAVDTVTLFIGGIGGKFLSKIGAFLFKGSKIIPKFSLSQLDRKFKHASDFGIVTTKKNPQTLLQFQMAITSHLDDASTISRGTYGFVQKSQVFFNPNTNIAVVLDKSSNFITGFKLLPGSKQFENFTKRGILR